MSIEVLGSVYIISAILFVFGLKLMSSPATAVRGNMLSSVGMLMAVLITLTSKEILDYRYLAGAAVLGAVVGVIAAQRVAMTGMPEMVALFNGSGGIASLLVGWAALYGQESSSFTLVTILLSILIGGVTFSGSLVAWAKLSETIGSGAMTFSGQRVVNILLLLALLGCSIAMVVDPGLTFPLVFVVIGLSILLGVMAVIPIGGADMPVVISLLNSYSGLAACAAGFAINNTILIVAGSLVGAAGLILTNIMCKAMNRSLSNVLFSGFAATTKATKVEGEVKPITADDAYLILEAASSVVMVPGYGMAVAQAQHVVRELGELLEANGADVSYAIHPVAGRMPGHMNVLLAEANVPYDQLIEMDEINPRMESVDVAIVIGANDVVNPAAREDENSPIYGMPIINVDYARTVFVLKRSMASGFSGVDNPLFFGENTRMLFGDAKQSLSSVIAEFKS
ncbi:NAD(P)(+) transhydrogenase (Re/Si-specific) subunit beta [Rhodopirellula europaea]|jgi:NAD(P) transhydrogenase subunit beta|uniref:NAD(P) transhydrogenase subunit beta n=1 Tax=Rhodopirellula europaea SH398 TaxID=1263868 RepID=M5S6E0_9BACT|nr:NAD(P)(+) transhydrogenase (Re/Si-specific) subunit beta [Rhodopirellula europaea]EMI27021.1 NAD(p) transhydrogenase subunit beta [Rhodopirellula europaea SH398]MCR9209346.1 NAD(P)(+) transhydrogenase (Re/Si-specific) subunit beta [bacterium]|tara:strand:- start:201 stop:1562 length:1362 start_codon:yes stop_codon:yes gene_type:complete